MRPPPPYRRPTAPVQERQRSIANQVDILKAKIEQTKRDLTGRSSQEAALTAQLASYDTEIKAVSPLVEKGYYARNKFLALVRDRTRIDGELGLAKGEIARLTEGLEEVQAQIRQTTHRFLEDVAQQLADARAKLSDLREKLAVAEDVLTRVEVRAARAGIVQAVKVHGVGAVIRAGDTIAEIVPLGDSLIMAARVSPLDIDSVREGQKAEVRFPAFSSRQAPTILGNVTSISATRWSTRSPRSPITWPRSSSTAPPSSPTCCSVWCPACRPTCSSPAAGAPCSPICSTPCAARWPSRCASDEHEVAGPSQAGRSRLDHHSASGPSPTPTASRRNAASQPVALAMPPPASSATPMAQPPAADRPKPTVECMAMVAPRYSGWALSVMPEVSAPESAGMAMA